MCPEGNHDYTEAFDERSNGTMLKELKGGMDPEVIRATLYYRVVKFVYCRRCGNIIRPEITE